MASKEEVGVIAVVDNYRTFETQIGNVASGISGVGTAGKRSSSGVAQFNLSIDDLITSLAGMAAIRSAVNYIINFGEESVAAANAAEEMGSKFDAVFKEEAPAARKELELFANSVNRSVQPLLGFAATIQDTLVPLGFARSSAADMSVEIVKLANDLSSFNDVPVEEVIAGIQSALVGNVETLKRYGVAINQATIENKALEMGLITNKGELDAQSKAQAVLALLMEGTSDAQGDLARTMDSGTNITREYEDSILDLKIAIGKDLSPEVSKAQRFIANLAREYTGAILVQQAYEQAVQNQVITQKEANRILDGMRRGLISTDDAMQNLRDITGETNDQFEDTAEEVKRVMVAFGDTGEAAQRYAENIREQARENVNAARTRELLNASHEAGFLSDEALEVMTLQLKDGTLELSQAQIQAMQSAIDNKTQQDELNEILEKQTEAAVNAAISQQQLSESLVDANKARLAAEAIRALQQAMKEDPERASIYAAEIEEIQLQEGLATESSIRFAKILQALPGAMQAGIAPTDALSEGVAKLDNNLNETDVDAFLKEIGVTEGELEPFIQALQTTGDEASGVGTKAEAGAQQAKQAYDPATFAAIGTQAGQGLADGFDVGLEEFQGRAEDLPADIEATFAAVPWYDIGVDIGQNIAGGLSASISDIGWAAADIASAINQELEAIVTRYVVEIQVNANTTTQSYDGNAQQALSAPQAISAPGSVSSIENNFNLEAITNLGPEAITQSFNTMRLLV